MPSTGMDIRTFQSLARYLGFDEKDLSTLRTVLPRVEPHLDGVVDEFYRVILEHPVTREILRDPAQVSRLKLTLRQWLQEIFSAPRDAEYLARRNRVGTVHVRIGLPQAYVFGAMGLIRMRLERTFDLELPDAPLRHAAREALGKSLDMDLAILSDSYLEADKYRDMRRQEHLAAIGTMAVTLAHEVKNPLSGISGAMQILAGTAAPEHAEVFAEIQNQINRLNRLMENLLRFGRPVQLRTEMLPMGPLARRIFSVLKDGPDLREVSLEVSGEALDIPLALDTALMQQVLVNLFLNAAQAMEGSGTIRIEARRAPDHVLFIVSDTGPGVPAGSSERVFEPFFTSKPQGSGLGLSICRKIVEAHGGTLQIGNDGMPGAAFEIRLPL